MASSCQPQSEQEIMAAGFTWSALQWEHLFSVHMFCENEGSAQGSGCSVSDMHLNWKERKQSWLYSLSLHHTCKDTENAFQTSGSIVTTVHAAWILICYLQMGYSMDAAAQFPRSCTMSSIHICQGKENIWCILHCQTEGREAQNSCGFILLRGTFFCLFFS